MQAHRGKGQCGFIWHLIGRLTPRRVTTGQRETETGRVREGRKIACFHSQISLAAVVLSSCYGSPQNEPTDPLRTKEKKIDAPHPSFFMKNRISH